MPAEPLCQGGSSSDSSSSQPTDYQETTDSSSTALEKTLTSDEDEAVQHSRKRREQFRETLAGYKDSKLKKTVPASSQSAHFAEKELQLRERMFEKLEAVSEEQTKSISLLTSQLSDLTKTMSSAFMLLQQSIQMPNPFPYTSRMFLMHLLLCIINRTLRQVSSILLNMIVKLHMKTTHCINQIDSDYLSLTIHSCNNNLFYYTHCNHIIASLIFIIHYCFYLHDCI